MTRLDTGSYDETTGRSWLEINLDNIAHNVKVIEQLVGPSVKIMAVVKANAYGHGAVEVSEVALAAGASYLGVATVEEGVELRRGGISAPILLLGYVPLSQVSQAIESNLTLTLFDRNTLRVVTQKAATADHKARVHVKLDTGMGRLGLRPGKAAVSFVEEVASTSEVELEGIFTHLSSADEDDPSFTLGQLELFNQFLDQLARLRIDIPMIHAANSAGIFRFPQAHYNMVRPGISIYGLEPFPGALEQFDLKPALAWKTRVAYLKDVPAGTPISYGRTYVSKGKESIATIPVGYADGLRRLLSNVGEVLIGGRRMPIVGRVSMDQTMVKIEHSSSVKVGDEVVIIGEQQGDVLRAEEMAEKLGTINYEIATLLSKRLPRIFIRNGHVWKIATLLGSK